MNHLQRTLLLVALLAGADAASAATVCPSEQDLAAFQSRAWSDLVTRYTPFGATTAEQEADLLWHFFTPAWEHTREVLCRAPAADPGLLHDPAMASAIAMGHWEHPSSAARKAFEGARETLRAEAAVEAAWAEAAAAGTITDGFPGKVADAFAPPETTPWPAPVSGDDPLPDAHATVVPGTWYRVQAGDTLGGIAQELRREADVDLPLYGARGLIEILRVVNHDLFDGGHALAAGDLLFLPEGEQIAAIDPAWEITRNLAEFDRARVLDEAEGDAYDGPGMGGIFGQGGSTIDSVQAWGTHALVPGEDYVVQPGNTLSDIALQVKRAAGSDRSLWGDDGLVARLEAYYGPGFVLTEGATIHVPTLDELTPVLD